MIKVFIVMASVMGLLFYFLGDREMVGGQKEKKKDVAGLQRLASLPGSISESSGIEVLSNSGDYITHNDAGNKSDLYQINAKGEIVKTFSLNVPNNDWEDLTRDDNGNLYIADTGNNDNNRKELAIYKVSSDDIGNATAIRFTYEDQKEYPPSKKDRNFDSEAVFWHGGKLYIITKDRGQEQTANIYTVPDKPGTYKARLVGSADFKGLVTGAAVSPDGKKIILLEEERVHLFTGFRNPAKFYEGDSKKTNLKGAGQTEAVAFEDNNTIVLTSEGGNLYRYKF